jgi:hypothetical protein
MLTSFANNVSPFKKTQETSAVSFKAGVGGSCNPNYLGSRDQEDHGSKPTWTNSSQDPYLEKKNPFHKKRMVEWLKV